MSRRGQANRKTDPGKRYMGLIKLTKSNEAGDEVGVVYVNTDQIVAISAGPSATELQMTDGRTRWGKETPDEVVALAKSSG